MAFLSACIFARFISESPEEIKTDRTFDSPAGVLCDYRFCEIKVRIALRNRDQDRCSQRNVSSVDRNRGFRCQRKTLGSDRSFVRIAAFLLFKKDETLVLVEQGVDFIRVVLSPGPYVLHGQFMTLEVSLIDKPRSYCFVWTTVLIVVTDANKFAFFSPESSGALNLKEKDGDRIVAPRDGILVEVFASHDFCSRVVRNKSSSLNFSS